MSKQKSEPVNGGVLYVTATPIGNLEDVTFRSLRIFSECDEIMAEDTRVALKLLNHYRISKPVYSFNASNARTKTASIAEKLSAGRKIVLITDAGTPGVSDPGGELVSYVREKNIDCRIEPIPGPSALTAALSVSGMRTTEFTFLGFLPHKKGREKIFKEIAASGRAVVFYESPHRILKTLQSLSNVLDKDRKIFIGRELTKMHEQLLFGTAAELEDRLKEKFSAQVKGEFVVIVFV